MLDRFRDFRTRFPTTAVIIEVLSIVLGVGLAMLANEWRQSANRSTQLRQSMTILSEEISANQKILQQRVVRHQELYLNLSAVVLPVFTGEDVPVDSLSSLNWRRAPLRSSTYRTIESMGLLSQIDVSLASQITETYNQLSVVESYDQAFLERGISRFDFFDLTGGGDITGESFNAIAFMQNLMQTQLQTEVNQLERHRLLLRQLARKGIQVDTLSIPIDSLGNRAHHITDGWKRLNARLPRDN